MATASWPTCRGHDVMLPPKFRPNRFIGRQLTAFPIFSNMAAVRHLEFLKFVIFRHLLLCTKFHQNCFTRSASRCPQLLDVQCAVARQRPLPLQPHHGGHVWDVIGCDLPTFVKIGPLVGELWHFQHFPTWRPPTILNWNFVILDHPRSQPCGPINVSKFGVDLIFAVGDIAILSFCQFGWKIPNHASFSGVCFEPIKIVGRH